MSGKANGNGTPFFNKSAWYVKQDKKRIYLITGTEAEKAAYRDGKRDMKARPEVWTELARLVSGLPPQASPVVPEAKDASVSDCPTIGELVPKFLADVECRVGRIIGMYRVILASLVETMGETPIDEITPASIRAWVTGNKKWKSAHTQRLAIKRVRQLVHWCQDERILGEDQNPIKGLRLPVEPKREIGLTDDEVQIIVASSHPRFARFFRFTLLTGRRPNEIANLTVASVDNYNGKLCLRIGGKNKGKKGHGEFIPLATEAEAILREAISEAELRVDGLLFPSERGERYNDHNWNKPLRHINHQGPLPRSISLGAFSVAKAATPAKPVKIRQEITLYYCRFEYINRALRRGVPPAVIARLVGNSVKVILKYYESMSKVAVDDLARAAEMAVAG